MSKAAKTCVDARPSAIRLPGSKSLLRCTTHTYSQIAREIPRQCQLPFGAANAQDTRCDRIFRIM